MTARSPDVDVALQLQAAGLGNYDAGGAATIMRGPVREGAPALKAVTLWVESRAGAAPQPYMPAIAMGSYFSAELNVTALAEKYDDALALARQVRVALHVRAPTDAALAAYVSLTANTSEPLNLGVNDAGFWKLRFVFTITWRE